MSAFEELTRTGALGGETVALLRQLGRQFTRTHSFPPSEEHQRWSDDAVDALLATMLATKGPAFVLSCYLKATDEASLERLLLAAIRNHLIDEAKGTERGKLRRRLDNLLGQDTRFRHVPASSAGVVGWALAGAPGTLTSSSVTDLQRAAFARRGVSIARWNSAGPTPTATREALLAIAHAVLTAADGVVASEDLARVVESRFALLAPPQFTALHADRAWADPATDPGDGPEVLVEVSDVAEALWRELSRTERAVFPHLGKPDADLAIITGTGPRQARAVANALAERVRLATLDDPHRDDVVLVLLQLCVARP